jgi:hypothetical protein
MLVANLLSSLAIERCLLGVMLAIGLRFLVPLYFYVGKFSR